MKNACDKLPLYLYNEMSEKEMMEFKKHLLFCRECRDLIAAFRDIKPISKLQNAPKFVIEEIFNKTTRKPRFWTTPRILKSSLAAAACLFIGFAAIFQNSNDVIVYSSSYNISPISYEEISS
ncbi:MAG: zf-HC2 domain-containing protein, partial [Elusimicrobiota bacterium]|nr:zf-HC2 domain-containing protein [Elusimicrobiota bacterium]